MKAYKVWSRLQSRTDWWIAKGFPHFLFDLTNYAGTKKVLLRGIKRSQAKFRSSSRDEDLVLRHMASWCMMFCVRYAPSMVRYAESRKKCQLFNDNFLAVTYALWRIQPTVLLIVFDSEKAWWPHSCPMTQIPVPKRPAQNPYNAQRDMRATVYKWGLGNASVVGLIRASRYVVAL